MDICVGDAVELVVEVHSSLPQAIPLKDLSLTLALLQDVTVAYSPKSATSSSRTDFSRTNSSLRRQKAADGESPTATGIVRTQSGDLGSAVTAAAAGEDADVVTQWQETEELLCSLARAKGSSQDEASHISTDAQQLETVQITAGTAVLQPGVQRLVFRAHPLKRGLYSLKHMTASLHQLALHIPALPRQAPHALDTQRHSVQQHTAIHPVTPDPLSANPPVLGTVANTGLLQQQTVVLNAHSCRQRVAVSAAALKGALIAGQPQWLAIAVMPLHDSLREACIHVGLSHQSRHGISSGNNPLAASLGSRSSTASSVSHSLEDSTTAGHSLEFLHPDRAVAAPLPSKALATPPHPSRSTPSLTPNTHTHSPPSTKASSAAFTPLPEQEPSSSRSQADADEEMQSSMRERRDGGSQASTSGSSWVSLEHNHGSNMPAWAATQPSLLWLWVQPGRPCHTMR